MNNEQTSKNIFTYTGISLLTNKRVQPNKDSATY